MKLTVKTGAKQIAFSVEPGTPLPQALAQPGLFVTLPCGGAGRCGRCRIKASGALSPPTAAERRLLSEAELRAGVRLLCQAVALGDACVELSGETERMEIAGDAQPQGGAVHPVRAQAYAAAVDLGTTTVAARLYALTEAGGAVVASAGRGNPQAAFGADVLTRMQRAQAGDAVTLQESAGDCIDGLLGQLLQTAGVEAGRLTELVITGNTAMLSLLTGEDTACLAKAPFRARRLFGEAVDAWRLGLRAAPGCRVYLPRCASAFIGADCLCAMLACGLTQAKEPCALIDLGTNAEMVLFDGSAFWCASAAAGPAFEGGGISMGMMALPGAIDHVERKGFQIRCSTIGDQAARGICGSGLVDAVAVLLGGGILAADGTICREGHPFRAMVCERENAPAVHFAGTGVFLTQSDIRALQTAKAAVRAGLQTLLNCAGLQTGQVRRLFLAGGFGRFLNLENAAAIGLIPPALAERTICPGNAALDGAGLLAIQKELREPLERLAQRVHTISLAEEPGFAQAYLCEMNFTGP